MIMKKTVAFFVAMLFMISCSITANAYNVWAWGGNQGDSISESYLHFHAWSGFTTATKYQFDLAFDEWNYNCTSAKPWIDRSGDDTSQTVYPVRNYKNEITKGARGTDKYLMETYATYSTTYGGIMTLYEVDIDVNGSHAWYNSVNPNKYFVQNAFTHEVGHVYGLHHESSYASGTPKPTMYPQTVKGDYFMCTIESDDIAGIYAIYGGP